MSDEAGTPTPEISEPPSTATDILLAHATAHASFPSVRSSDPPSGLSSLLESLQLGPLTQHLHPLFKDSLHFQSLVKAANEKILACAKDCSLVASLRVDLDQLNAERETDKINHEQRVHSFEKISRKLTDEITALKTQTSTLQSQLTEKDTLLTTTSQKLDSLQSNLTSLSQKSSLQSSTITSLESEKRSLLEIISRSTTQSTTLESEITNMENSLKHAKDELTKKDEKLVELQSELFEVKHKLVTSDQILQSVKTESEIIANELTKKSDEYLRFRKQKVEEIHTVKIQLEQLSVENSGLKSENETLKSTREALEKKIESLVEKLKHSEENAILQSEQFKNEMTAQKRLSELMTGENTDLRDRNNELESLLEQVEAALESHESQNKLTVQELQDRVESLTTENNTLSEKIERLESQIRGVNDAMIENKPALGLLSPTAKIVSTLQKTGKTYTEVYSEYTKIQEELVMEKRETKRLQDILKHVLEEISERAPVMQQLKEDYELSREKVEELSLEMERLGREKAEAVEIQREAERMREEAEEKYKNVAQGNYAHDLSRQVQALLRELELLRNPDFSSSIINDKSFETDRVYEEEGGADAIISERLVVFRNIEELQQQNKTLRRSLRTLSKKLEDMETNRTEVIERGVSKELSDAVETIKSLQERVRGLGLQVKSFQRERDQWKKIAETRSGSVGVVGGGSGDLGGNGVVGARSEEYVELYKNLQAEFDLFRKESGVDTRMLKEQNEVLSREKNNLSVQNAKLNTQLEYQNERYQMLQKSKEQSDADSARLSQRLATLSNAITQQDLKLQELTEKLVEAHENEAAKDGEVRRALAEVEMLRASEQRILAENQYLVQERNRANSHLTNVQRVYDEMEKSTKDHMKKLEERVAVQEKEINVLRKQNADVNDDLRTLNIRKESDSKDMQTRLDKLVADNHKLREELLLAKTNNTHLNTRVSELQQQLNGVQEQLSVYQRVGTSGSGEIGGDVSDEGRIRELEVMNAKLRVEVNECKEQIRLEQERVETYKGIGAASEEQLEQLNSSYDAYKASMESQLEETKAQVEALQKKCTELEQQVTRGVLELNELTEKVAAERAWFEQEKQLINHQLSNAKLNEEQALRDQESLREQSKRDAQAVIDAKREYEQEHISHSEKINQLNKMRDELRKAKDSFAAASERAAVAEANVKSLSAAVENAKRQLSEEKEELSRRLEDLKSQNNILHSQLENVTSKVHQIQEQQTEALLNSNIALDSTSIDQTTTATPPDQEKTLRELHDLIKFIRRERDIERSKYDVSHQENERLRHQIEHTTRSLDETRQLLDEERRRSNVSQETEMKHAELMEKINQLSVLRESNNTLREACEGFKKKILGLEKDNRGLKDQVTPLSEENAQLKGELEARMQEIKTLEDVNQKWKARTQDILSKHERVDPQEHSKLKEESVALKAEVERLKEEWDKTDKALQEMTTKYNEVVGAIVKIRGIADNWKKKASELELQLKALKDESSKPSTSETELNALKDQHEKLHAQMAELRTTAQSERSALIAQTNEHLGKAKTKIDQLKREIVELNEQRKQRNVSSDPSVQKFTEEKATETDVVPQDPATQTQQTAATEAQPAVDIESLKTQLSTELRGTVEKEVEMRYKVKISMAENAQKKLKKSNEEMDRRIKELEKTLANESAAKVEQQQASLTVDAAVVDLANKRLREDEPMQDVQVSEEESPSTKRIRAEETPAETETPTTVGQDVEMKQEIVTDETTSVPVETETAPKTEGQAELSQPQNKDIQEQSANYADAEAGEIQEAPEGSAEGKPAEVETTAATITIIPEQTQTQTPQQQQSPASSLPPRPTPQTPNIQQQIQQRVTRAQAQAMGLLPPSSPGGPGQVQNRPVPMRFPPGVVPGSQVQGMGRGQPVPMGQLSQTPRPMRLAGIASNQQVPNSAPPAMQTFDSAQRGRGTLRVRGRGRGRGVMGRGDPNVNNNGGP